MKKFLLLLTLSFMAVGLVACNSSTNSNTTTATTVAQQSTPLEGDVLVVYYSHTGTTKAFAENIANVTGGDLFELQTDPAYPKSPNDLVSYAGSNPTEYKDAKIPQLVSGVPNLADYEYVFLGTPIWYEDASLPVKAFLQSHDFNENQVVFPFTTAGNSDGQGALATIKTMINKGRVTNVLDSYADMSRSEQDILNWINENK